MTYRFSRVPLEACMDRRLSLEQLRVLIALFSFLGRNAESVWASRDAIAARCRTHPNNVSAATSALERLGWLKKTGKGGRSSPCSYQMMVPDMPISVPDAPDEARNTLADSATVCISTEPETIAESATVLIEKEPETLADSASQQPETLVESARGKEQTIKKTDKDKEVAAVAAAIPPKKRSRRKPKGVAVTFSDCLEQAKQAGKKIIEEDDSIYGWAEDASIPDEWLALAWDEFCNRYRHNPKTYIDWAATYRNAVRGNWFKLWRYTPNGQLLLTTEGETARRVRAAAEKRRASSGPVSAHA